MKQLMERATYQPGTERRDDHRARYSSPVRIYATPGEVDDSFVLDSTDLGADSVFIHTDLLFPEGELLDLEFEVPGTDEPVRGTGEVVRVERRGESSGPGIAVKIGGLSQAGKDALAEIKRALAE